MIKEIINKYDHFILDIWGVIHNGVELIPYAQEFIIALQDRNKNFCLFSNAPRPSSIVIAKLHDLGLNNITKDRVTTSGDIFIDKLSNDYADKKIYLLGEKNNTDLLDGRTFIQVTDINEADFILVLAVGLSEAELTQYNNLLQVAAAMQIPMLCPNPDIVVNHGGKIVYTPGAYARIYENMGGKAVYFGKPHKESYQKVLSKYGMDPKKTIMIGDSLETDIRGATNSNMDSLLLLTGIHRNDKDIEEVCSSFGLKPNYILPDLALNLRHF